MPQVSQSLKRSYTQVTWTYPTGYGVLAVNAPYCPLGGLATNGSAPAASAPRVATPAPSRLASGRLLGRYAGTRAAGV